ncbi:MAG TPA: hypothetical protein VHA06_02355 [Candidatus Angelobacter sp.]|jgi:hypothetical protein|nr:hypothetical protein [Candidatus Angelobacter sp.]
MTALNRLPGIGVKLIALLLIVGGGTGATFTMVAESRLVFKAGIEVAAVYGLFVLLFGWCAWTGYGLWKDEAWASRNSKLIFAAQIPIFAVPGFSFDGFSTGFRVYFIVRSQFPVFRFGFDLSPALHLAVLQETSYWAFGINLVAIIALAHLMSVDRPVVKQDNFGLI